MRLMWLTRSRRDIRLKSQTLHPPRSRCHRGLGSRANDASPYHLDCHAPASHSRCTRSNDVAGEAAASSEQHKTDDNDKWSLQRNTYSGPTCHWPSISSIRSSVVPRDLSSCHPKFPTCGAKKNSREKKTNTRKSYGLRIQTHAIPLLLATRARRGGLAAYGRTF
jgi:hypothetical protein